MTQTPKNDTAPEAPLTWTSSEQWGTVGKTYSAEVTLDNGDTWTFQVDQPRKGHWVARGWRDLDFALYREDRTMKGARAQCQAKANLAATSSCDECREIAGHTLTCPTLAPEPVADGCCGDQDNPAVAHSTDGTGCWEILAPAPLTAVDEGVTLLTEAARSIAKAVAPRFAELAAAVWKGLRRPAGCVCPTPTHTMRCGAGARPVVVSR